MGFEDSDVGVPAPGEEYVVFDGSAYPDVLVAPGYADAASRKRIEGLPWNYKRPNAESRVKMRAVVSIVQGENTVPAPIPPPACEPEQESRSCMFCTKTGSDLTGGMCSVCKAQRDTYFPAMLGLAKDAQHKSDGTASATGASLRIALQNPLDRATQEVVRMDNVQVSPSRAAAPANGYKAASMLSLDVTASETPEKDRGAGNDLVLDGSGRNVLFISDDAGSVPTMNGSDRGMPDDGDDAKNGPPTKDSDMGMPAKSVYTGIRPSAKKSGENEPANSDDFNTVAVMNDIATATPAIMQESGHGTPVVGTDDAAPATGPQAILFEDLIRTCVEESEDARKHLLEISEERYKLNARHEARQQALKKQHEENEASFVAEKHRLDSAASMLNDHNRRREDFQKRLVAVQRQFQSSNAEAKRGLDGPLNPLPRTPVARPGVPYEPMGDSGPSENRNVLPGVLADLRAEERNNTSKHNSGALSGEKHVTDEMVVEPAEVRNPRVVRRSSDSDSGGVLSPRKKARKTLGFHGRPNLKDIGSSGARAAPQTLSASEIAAQSAPFTRGDGGSVLSPCSAIASWRKNDGDEPDTAPGTPKVRLQPNHSNTRDLAVLVNIKPDSANAGKSDPPAALLPATREYGEPGDSLRRKEATEEVRKPNDGLRRKATGEVRKPTDALRRKASGEGQNLDDVVRRKTAGEGEESDDALRRNTTAGVSLSGEAQMPKDVLRRKATGEGQEEDDALRRNTTGEGEKSAGPLRRSTTTDVHQTGETQKPHGALRHEATGEGQKQGDALQWNTTGEGDKSDDGLRKNSIAGDSQTADDAPRRDRTGEGQKAEDPSSKRVPETGHKPSQAMPKRRQPKKKLMGGRVRKS